MPSSISASPRRSISRSSAATCARVAREGLVESGANTQLDGHAEHGGEYVNVYHADDYVRRTWGRWFDVLAILPGYILHHDLVVMRKR